MRGLRGVVLVGVVLTVATLVVGPLAGEVPDCATGSVLELEVARTEAKAVELLGGCDDEGLEVLRDGLRTDNLAYVPLYVGSVALWCLLGARRLTWSSEPRRLLVVGGAVAIVVAGLFDLVENHYLAEVVDAAGASDAAGPAFAASAVKWVLVLYAVPTALIAAGRCLRAAWRS